MSTLDVFGLADSPENNQKEVYAEFREPFEE